MHHTVTVCFYVYVQPHPWVGLWQCSWEGRSLAPLQYFGLWQSQNHSSFGVGASGVAASRNNFGCWVSWRNCLDCEEAHHNQHYRGQESISRYSCLAASSRQVGTHWFCGPGVRVLSSISKIADAFLATGRITSVDPENPRFWRFLSNLVTVFDSNT